jgi:hypothetical protein
MKKNLMLKISVILMVITTVFLLIGLLGSNNTAKMIGFVLLIISTILNAVIKYIK